MNHDYSLIRKTAHKAIQLIVTDLSDVQEFLVCTTLIQEALLSTAFLLSPKTNVDETIDEMCQILKAHIKKVIEDEKNANK